MTRRDRPAQTRPAESTKEHPVSDQSLQRAVMEALAGNPRVHASEIAVQVTDGDALLRGTVGSVVQQVEAARTAREVAGVRHVDDRLAVRALGIDGRADADTQAAVLAALIDDDRIHARGIDVAVHDGVVTLSGIVEVASQRDIAERIALGVGGVQGVRNELRVWLTVSADDVAERVTDAIGADAIVGADRITVTVVDNDVTLTGTVRSPEHRETAVAAAARAPGVMRVHDQLTVGAPKD
jgi:osmotically-inducible protein OsmY